MYFYTKFLIPKMAKCILGMDILPDVKGFKAKILIEIRKLGWSTTEGTELTES